MNRVTGWVGVILLFSSAATPVLGVDLFWQGSGVAGNLTGNNWANTTGGTNLAPTSADVLHIGGNGNATHSIGDPISFSKLRVGHNQTPTGAPPSSNGTGTATISNDAQVSLTGGTGDNAAGAALWVGNGRNGTLTIDGAETSVTSNSYVVIGYTNNTGLLGTVNVQNGAELIVTTGAIEMGLGTGMTPNGTRGRLTLSGEGSKITLSESGTDMNVGRHAAKSEYFQSGGTLDVSGLIAVGRDRANESNFIVTGGVVNGGGFNVGLDSTEASTIAYPDNCFAEFTGTAQANFSTGNVVIGAGDAVGTKFTIADQAAVKLLSTSANGNFFLGRGTSQNTTFTMSGGSLETGQHFLMGSASGATNILANHSGGTITTTQNFVVADGDGDSTYNLSDAGVVDSKGLMIVGRQGTGIMNQTGGTVTVARGLEVGHAHTSTTSLFGNGTYNVSGGTISTAQVEGGTALSIGMVGTGLLRVIGDDAEINVNGDMAVNPLVADGSQGTLAYQLEAGELLSLISVTGNAVFNTGSILSLDIANEPTPASSYDALTAASIDASGLTFNGPAGWNYSIVDGGLGKILRFAQDAGPGLPGDHNGDGNVDILDYVVWRMDPANNGGDPDGFDDWAENYGNPSGSGSGAGQSAAVPEPATAGMVLVIGLIGLFGRAIRRR